MSGLKNAPQYVSEIFDFISEELIKLEIYWSMYRDLYASSTSVDLLNQSAGLYFATTQRIWLDWVALAICRLVDPAVTKVKGETLDNMTFPQLSDRIAASGNERLVGIIEPSLGELKANCETLRQRRNKIIAHLDAKTVLDPTKLAELGFSRDYIAKCLQPMRNILNAISLHYDESTTAFGHCIVPLGTDANALLSNLVRALEYRKLEASDSSYTFKRLETERSSIRKPDTNDRTDQ